MGRRKMRNEEEWTVMNRVMTLERYKHICDLLEYVFLICSMSVGMVRL
jgi:hypothetical protein